MPTALLTSLLLLSLPLISSSPHTTNGMDPTERETLFLVMDSLSSDKNWRSAHPDPCTSPWPGLECSLLHVTRLDFGSPSSPTCKPTAQFPPEAFRLPHLRSLFLFNCFRTTKTSIPSPTNHPPSLLLQLSLRSNPSLVGPIPPLLSAFTSLAVLTLSQNRLSGQIPHEISLLSSLVHLDLSYNSLSGHIPPEIVHLDSIVNLDFSYNSLSGAIPSSIGLMNSLQKLDLSSNSLSGTIPESLTNLTLLTFLALSGNALTGGFPATLPRLRNLQYLLMDDNPMDAPLPSRLGRLSRLQEIRLANSGYRGAIPGSFAWLGNLTTLSLENNRLTGEIPKGLTALRRMYHLNLSRNMLGGVVPFDAGFVARLGGNLDLSGNPGLCVDGSERYVGVKVGVGICGSNASAMVRSNAVRFSFLSTLLLGILAVLGVYHWLL